jgi:hypothetical protein
VTASPEVPAKSEGVGLAEAVDGAADQLAAIDQLSGSSAIGRRWRRMTKNPWGGGERLPSLDSQRKSLCGSTSSQAAVPLDN